MEEWRDCIGFEGKYQVSSIGRVKSLPRTTKRNGRDFQVKGRIMSLANTPQGYKSVTLKVLGKMKTMRVHRLVGYAFLGKEKEMINHIDGNKSNNVLSNLEWASRSENELHAYRTGMKKSSDLHKKRTSDSNKERRKISTDTIQYIRMSNLSQYKLSSELGLSRSMIGLIKQRKRYADIE